jgi:hypothetical protein
VAVVLTTALLLDSVVGQVAVDRDMLEHRVLVQPDRATLADLAELMVALEVVALEVSEPTGAQTTVAQAGSE